MAIERKRSARGRADAAIRSVVDRRAVGKDSASAPEAPPAPAGRAATGQRPQSAGRHFVDSAQRCSLAGFAGRIPASLHVLAAIAGLEEQEVWLEIWRAFLGELNERQQVQWS